MTPSTAVAAKPLKVAMGGIDYACRPDELETLLGSCVGIALWDSSTGWGGLAHVVLPDSRGQDGPPGKFADTAVPTMLDELARRGANLLGITAKLAGGATMFGTRKAGDIGQRNYEAVVELLKRRRIRVVAEEIGGTKGRIVRLNTGDGSLQVFVGRELVRTL